MSSSLIEETYDDDNISLLSSQHLITPQYY